MILSIAQIPDAVPREVLAADVGATKTNIASFRWDGENLVTLRQENYRTKVFAAVAEMIAEFARGMELPEHVCLGVAGPVLDNRVNLTNLHWKIDGAELSKQFKTRVELLNDLEATARALALMDAGDLHVVHEGENALKGNVAVIAPGTGLGEAGLYFDGHVFHPFATEGGHASFAPSNPLDVELYQFLAKTFGHVSWERVVSGPGICHIYDFLVHEKEREEPVWLKDKMLVHDKAAVISEHASECPVCGETMEIFIRYLASEAASLALKLKATGGVFIGGGIVPHLLPLIHETDFEKHFCNYGRMKDLLRSVPVHIILNDKAALLGAAHFALRQRVPVAQPAF